MPLSDRENLGMRLEPALDWFFVKFSSVKMTAESTSGLLCNTKKIGNGTELGKAYLAWCHAIILSNAKLTSNLLHDPGLGGFYHKSPVTIVVMHILFECEIK